jgi:lipopolysaccharide transport system ATP-binding protein
VSTIIAAEHVTKRYKRYPSQWARLGEWLSLGRRIGHERRWALRDVTFGIRPRESVGIIGQNGAGKSTLLKILTGTAQPTEGRVRIQGRVSALLELGLGFHPDFSGRTNALMTCQMMGLSRSESERLLPEIEAFSELSDYMDQPMRVYSTGMQVRLAFSAATAVRPEILVVDEALSVGDTYFQHKCMQRIRAFKEKGTTLLFVSHDPAAVKSLCERALLLDQGSLIKDGEPDELLDYYNALVARQQHEEEIQQVENAFGRQSTRSGSGDARIRAVDLLGRDGRSARAFRVGESARLKLSVSFHKSVADVTVGFIIRDRLGNDVFGTNTRHLKVSPGHCKPGEKLELEFAVVLNLGRGHYAISLAVHQGFRHVENSLDWWDQCLVFQVVPGSEASFVGTAALPVSVEIKRKERQ